MVFMSFDIGPIKQPMIQSSQRMQNDGGGGNLGYMSQGRKKKDEEEKEKELLSADESDVLQLNIDDEISDFKEDEDNFSASKWIGSIAEKIAGKIHKKPSNPFQNI